jgi:FkbM family methyltransferase
VSIVVRHHTPDVLVLDEVFSQREYEFPPAVQDVLHGVASPLRIVDLGANIGLFGAFVFTRYPHARIVAFEPDPANAAIHARAIEANPTKRWTLVQAAAAAAPGTMRFSSGDFTRSHAARAGEDAIAVAAEDVLPRIREADLVKIDIEGGEWALLGDARFAGAEACAVVVEYHPESCPGSDPQAEAERALVSAGFKVSRGSAKPEFRTGILWGWRQRQAQSIP